MIFLSTLIAFIPISTRAQNQQQYRIFVESRRDVEIIRETSLSVEDHGKLYVLAKSASTSMLKSGTRFEMINIQ
jgi:hypothetical protein